MAWALTPEETEYCRTAQKMIREQERLRTFKQWIFANDANCSAAKLAEAGFYFCGSSKEPDVVQCFLCEKSLDGWEKSDDPWKEHINHAPYCDFAKAGKPEKQKTLVDMMHYSETVLHRCVDKIYADQQNVVISDAKRMQKTITAITKLFAL